MDTTMFVFGQQRPICSTSSNSTTATAPHQCCCDAFFSNSGRELCFSWDKQAESLASKLAGTLLLLQPVPPSDACGGVIAGSAALAQSAAAKSKGPKTRSSSSSSAAAPAPAPADASSTPRLLQLPFSLQQRIAQHLWDEDLTTNARTTSTPTTASSSCSRALLQLSSTCVLLRRAVLATLPHLVLQLQQLPDLAACQHSFASTAVLTIEVRTNSDPMTAQDVLQLQQAMPHALARVPYVRHVAFKGMRSALLPLLQQLQRLPHLQEVTLVGRKGKMTVLPWVLAHANTAAAQQAAQQAAADQAVAPQQQPVPQQLQQATSAVQSALPAQAPPKATACRSYKDMLLACRNAGSLFSRQGSSAWGRNSTSTKSSTNSAKSSNSSITAKGPRRFKQDPGSSKTSSSSGSMAAKAQVPRDGMLAAWRVPQPGPIVHNLSSIQRLTLRRYNLCSIRYSVASSSSTNDGGSGSSSSISSGSFCPLALLAQHLTRLQTLSLQQVVLDRASLASLAGSPWPAWRQPGSPRQPPTALRSCLQDLSLIGVKQKHLELHYVSALTALTALRLSGLKVVSGLGSSSGGAQGSGSGFWDESDSDDEDSDWEADEQQQQQGQGQPVILQADDPAVQHILLMEGLAQQQQQQQQGLAGTQQAAAPAQVAQQPSAAAAMVHQQQQQSSTPPSEPKERNLGRALAQLTKLSVLTINRVPTLISNSTGAGGSGSGIYGGSIHSGSSGSAAGGGGSSELLPDVLAALGDLSSLAAPMCLSDTRLPGAWGHWRTSLVSLQVASICLSSCWAPLPPLSALTALSVSGLLQVPQGFLGGFAPNLKQLSVGIIKAAAPLPASAARRSSTNTSRSSSIGSSSGAAAGVAAAAAAAAAAAGSQQQLVGLAALAADNVLEELVLLDCSFGSSEGGNRTNGNNQAQLHFGGVPDGAIVEPQAAAGAAAAAGAGAAGAGAADQNSGGANGHSSSDFWADLAARAAAINWQELEVTGGLTAVAAAVAAAVQPASSVAGAADSDGGDGDAAAAALAADGSVGDGACAAAAATAAGGNGHQAAANAAAPAAAAGGDAAAGVVPAAGAAPVAPAAATAASQDTASNSSGAAAVPCAADVRSLLLDCRAVRRLQLEKLEAGCSLVNQLPRVLYYWHRLEALRLHNVVNAFGDTALETLVQHHSSSLQHLSLVACKGITWTGVQGLQAATGLRSLRLGQLYPVTITSMLEAVSCMQQLTSLDAEALTAGWPASKVADNQPLARHLARTFETGRYWGTYTALRDDTVSVGSAPSFQEAAPYFKPDCSDYWEFYVGPADEAAVRAAAPQLEHLAIRG